MNQKSLVESDPGCADMWINWDCQRVSISVLYVCILVCAMHLISILTIALSDVVETA